MILFLFGQDTYRSKQRLRKIIEEYKKSHQNGLGFNKIDFEEKDFEDFKQAVETVSMYDKEKLILVENVFQQADEFQEKLWAYIEKRNLDKNKDNTKVTTEDKKANLLFVLIIFSLEPRYNKNKPVNTGNQMIKLKRGKLAIFVILF